MLLFTFTPSLRALSRLVAAGLVLPALAWTLGSCSDDAVGGAADGQGGATSYVRLDFSAPTAPSQRANPTGGPDGDGYEAGQTYENRIGSAVAFFFQSADGLGANADAATPVTAVYFPTVSLVSGPDNGGESTGATDYDAVYTTGVQPTSLPNGTWDVLVLANPAATLGADGAHWWDAQGLTLGQVRDHIAPAAWTTTAQGTYADFVMTSTADARITIQSNTEVNPARVSLDVGRLAARVDYYAEASYACTDPQYEGATAQIVGAAVVNDLTAGSYLLRRVTTTADVNAAISYLDLETLDADGVPTNYVLDPWTLQKTVGAQSVTLDGTQVAPSALYGTYLPQPSADPRQWLALTAPGTPLSGLWGGRSWLRAGYTLENVTAAEASGEAYATAVVFRAQFHPAGLTAYADGSTFFAWGQTLYPSMEAVMRAAYGSEWDARQAAIVAAGTWEEVAAQAAHLLLGDPSGYRAYLAALAQGRTGAVADDERAQLGWDDYMLRRCGYSATLQDDGTWSVSLNQLGPDAPSTREALAPHGVRTYEDGMCYYTWYVRHANDGDDQANGPMEYAIVRGNVYKLQVGSIYSLGDDVPGRATLVVHVYVNDWLLLPEETITL